MADILHVCTANQIRSPMAHLIMVDLIRHCPPLPGGSITIASAGLQAIAGEPLHPYAAMELDRRGIPHDGFSSTLFQPFMAGQASLVLAATRLQRDVIVSRAPHALHRTFTWRELAHLLSGTTRDEIPGTEPSERIANVAELARQRRGYARGLSFLELDVDDPMGGARNGYGRAAQEIMAAVKAIVEVL